jgi:hypothetical protein
VDHKPKAEIPRIDCIWAYLSVDPEDGNEGIVAGVFQGVSLPLIAVDEERLRSLAPMAEQIARKTGRVIRLVKFTNRELIRQLGGH